MAADIDLSEYDRPDLYDLENTADEDLEFFLGLAAEYGGPVLDIACGTGRIGIPLASQGYEVVGIDLSGPMLAHGRARAGGCRSPSAMGIAVILTLGGGLR